MAQLFTFRASSGKETAVFYSYSMMLSIAEVCGASAEDKLNKIWSTGAVTLMGKLNTWRKTCPSDPLSTINHVAYGLKQLSMRTVEK
jgi:hypothetical protein